MFVARIDAGDGHRTPRRRGRAASSIAELDDVFLPEGVTLPLRAQVRVRYRHEGAAARVEPGLWTARARVVFDFPVRAVTRGQMAVFYDGDRVVGGGRIAAVAQPAAAGA